MQELNSLVMVQGQATTAIYILANAFERAKTVEPDAVVKALEQTDMQGAIGRIRFGKDHQVVYGFDPKETALGVWFSVGKTWKESSCIPRGLLQRQRFSFLLT